MSSGFNVVLKKPTPNSLGKTQSSPNPLEDSELESCHCQGQHVRNSVFSKLAAQVRESMKFKSLVLLSPAAFELTEDFGKPLFFYASSLCCSATRSCTNM